VLAAILVLASVVGVASYLGARFVASHNNRWLAPTVLSSTDPRVLQVAASLQQETSRRNDLVFQQKELESRLRQAKRCVELEEGFQTSFKAALRSDLETRRAELARLQAALAEADSSADASDPHASEKSAALEARLVAARQRVRLLDAALRDGRATSSYEVLSLRRDYDQSLVASDAARELVQASTKALGDLEPALKAKDALIASLESSPYHLAISADVALGFVPYENMDAVKTGDAVMACSTALLLCNDVGTVGDVLPGEVRGLNPLGSMTGRGDELRGRLVRLDLKDARDGERSVLYAKRGPLF
jgi:hypothetical protein